MDKEDVKNVLGLDYDSELWGYLKDNYYHFTLAGYVDYLARNDGDDVALCHVDMYGNKRELTYNELSIVSNQMANYLKDKGVKKGDVVALVLRNNYEFFVVSLAILKLGAVMMPLQYTNKKPQYESIFKRANPKCVIACDYEIKQSEDRSAFVLNEIGEACDNDVIKICTNANSGFASAWETLDIYKNYETEFTNEEVQITDLGYLFSTSGTTGEPKLVMHNYGFALSHYYTGLWYGVKRGKKHLTICDSGWAMSSWNMSAVFLHHGTLYINDYNRFNAKELLKIIADEKINSLCAPRSILMLFIKALGDERLISNLRTISSAGEPIDENDRAIVKRHFGVDLRMGYGMTEVVLPIFENYQGVSSVSPLYSEVGVQKVDGFDEEEIVVKGSKLGLFMGYLDKNDRYVLYRKPPIVNGVSIWHTSDAGHVNSQGHICCDGRFGNTVKINDCLVNVSEVESVIRNHPMIDDCAVVCESDSIHGHSLTAQVELSDDSLELTESDVQCYVKSFLPDYCRPAKVIFTKLERTSSGKVKRKDMTPDKQLCRAILPKCMSLSS